MQDVHEATESDGITMANSQVEATSYIGNIAGDICDKHGRKLVSCTLGDVSYVKTCPYQLLSITKMINQGWLMLGDREGLTLTKGQFIIKTDIKIATPKGSVFAMMFKRSKELGEKQINVAEQGNNIEIEVEIAVEVEKPPVPDGGGDASVDSDNSEDSEDYEDEEETRVTKTRSGRMIQPSSCLMEHHCMVACDDPYDMCELTHSLTPPAC
jgi:hypothetical protein